VTDALAVKKHTSQAELYGHVNNVLCGQVVVVVIFPFAIAQKPAIHVLFYKWPQRKHNRINVNKI